MKARTLSILAATLCLQLSLTAADESATTSAPASPSSTQWWQDDSNPAGAATQPRYGDTPSNVTGRVGHSAFLPCTVQHLGDRSVTWMRQRDLHILTAGIFTYSADERFRVLHPENSNDWTLEIRFATLRDSGVYECHVNSDPKISRQVNLVVTDKQLDDPAIFGAATATTEPAPVVMIEGLTERHIQAGSVLSITCLVLHPLQQAPAHVLWFHGTENIDYDSPRGGVSIQTEKFPRKTRSQVMINNVRDTDSGEYSCSPSDLPPSVITVHVQHGQHHAAVQQGGLSGAPVTNPVTHFLLLLLILMFSRAR